jgi:hypothetical protein
MLSRGRENRKASRREMNSPGEVLFDVDRPLAHCVICDISDGGARLSMEPPIADLPPSFILVVHKQALVHRKCQVVWTNGRFVGVKFIRGDHDRKG